MDISQIMVVLRKIDNERLKVRDVIALEAIRETPGMMGRQCSTKLGLRNRAMLQDTIRRLIDHDVAEDRRIKVSNLTPNRLYITPRGVEFLDSLVQQHDL